MKTIIHSGRAKKFLLSVGACALVFFSLSLGWFTPDSMGQQPVITNITIIDGHVIIGYSAPEGAVDVERVQPNISREWTTVDSGVMARSWTDNPQDDVVFYRVVAVSTNLSQGDPMDTPLDDTIPDDGTGGDDLTNPADNPDDGTGDNPDDGSGDLPDEGSGSDDPYGSTPDDEPIASDADNNHASATPDPGVLKLYWRNDDDGRMAVWIMSTNGTRKSAGLADATAPTGWIVCGLGDLDQDGIDDIFWRNENTGQMAYWMMEADGWRKSAGDMGATAPSGWIVGGIGDLNKDNVPDIIWRNENTGQMAYWMMNSDGTRNSAGDMGATAPSGWIICGVGDINNDSVTDIIWRNENTGQMAYWMMDSDGTRNSAGDMGATAPTGWIVCGIGEINGDGSADMFWRNENSGQMAYWLVNSDGTRNSAGDMGATAPTGWIVCGIGDLNNDGTDDLIWRNDNTGQMAYWMVNSDGTRAYAGDMGATAPTGWIVNGTAL